MKTLPLLLILLSVLSGCVAAKKPSTGLGANDMAVNANSTNSSDSLISERDTAINSVKIEKAEATRTGEITVQILNLSKKPIKLWKDSNSWGAACWRVLLLRSGQLETFFQSPSQIFTLNRPTFGGTNVTFESTDTVIVIYDVPATQESRDKGVWYGVIAATATVQ